MNICIFAGTFNPIHTAHLQMAEFALKKYKFDKIIFIPSYIPPHKVLAPSLAEHRLNMVKLAIKYNSKFDVSDIEYKSQEKSYSIKTVKKIKDLYKIEGRVNFIIGTDAFVKIKSWYKFNELKDLVHFIVFPRMGSDELIDESYADFDYEIVDFQYIDVSSTEIRSGTIVENINNVRDYIKNYGLYL